MKKKIFAIALMALATAGASTAFAATDNKDSKGTCPQTECTAPGECRPEKCRPDNCPFEGLNLTADQQAQVKALREDCAKQRKADKEQLKADARKACDARKADALTKRADYLAKLKAILTPEQYVKFLENSFTNQGPRGPKFDGPRGDRKGHAFHGKLRDGGKRDGGRRMSDPRPQASAENK